ncbi:MAG TPA: hypothetical protein PKG60_06780 [Spirochaetota bacterium]|nr:hypothetical protein [Spirochaetota bacterium]HPS86721.1 hypothetical protein [Spirochaetota bacterium]
MLLKILLWINISFFILHEMDAIKTREWKMMIFINRLNDKTGHLVFTSSHFFLFIIIFYLMDQYFMVLFFAVSILLIIHQFMHIIFRRHAENRMNNAFSQIIIFMMFANSCLSLIIYAMKF